MILKRIAIAIRKRDWLSFAIEFAIVVLGVFVALQAGDWNQARKDRQLEQVYISRLIDEAKANIDMLIKHEQILEEKVHFIMALPDLSLMDAFRQDPQEFMYQVDFSTYVAIPNLRAETWQELESTGRVALLRDTQLRSALASTINDYRSTQPVFIQSIGNYRRLLFEMLPGRSYYDYRVGAGVDAGSADAAAILATIDAFRNDPRFGAAANAEITYGSDMLYYVRGFRQRMEDILALLQAGG